MIVSEPMPGSRKEYIDAEGTEDASAEVEARSREV